MNKREAFARYIQKSSSNPAEYAEGYNERDQPQYLATIGEVGVFCVREGEPFFTVRFELWDASRLRLASFTEWEARALAALLPE